MPVFATNLPKKCVPFRPQSLSFLSSLASLLRLLLLLLFGLQCRKVDVPEKHSLEDDGDKNDQEDGEENGLVIQNRDSLRRRANRSEPIELTHCCGLESFGVDRYSGAVQARWLPESCWLTPCRSLIFGGWLKRCEVCSGTCDGRYGLWWLELKVCTGKSK